MPQVDDLSRSLIAFEQNSTLVAVLEMSQQSWLAAGVIPGIDRHPLKKLTPDPAAVLQLLERWRAQAEQAGRPVKRIVLAFEAGRDGFWLARWLRARGVESYVIHSTSVAVSREHRRAKTDRLDTEMLIRVFLGWHLTVIRGGGVPTYVMALMPSPEWAHRLGTSPQKRITASWSASQAGATEYKAVVRVAHTDGGFPSGYECHATCNEVRADKVRGLPGKNKKKQSDSTLDRKVPMQGRDAPCGGAQHSWTRTPSAGQSRDRAGAGLRGSGKARGR